ncbi:MAG: hypothetical protein ABFC67_07580 [Mizugakiibacter sp.]|uniref:hypothetical protein n=1 Tax=Mizugakiibacter sp. TaxID=1972610 RepID=UPI0031C143BE|nr:hypothetical protein [Xanthomonadaceae bacterium]
MLYLIAALTLLLVAAWSALWMLSSYSMAFADCQGSFSLFAEQFRCRQPQLTVILGVSSLLLAALLLALRACIRSQVGRVERSE